MAATLDAVLHSSALLESRGGGRAELIVVDNASTDATAQVAKSFGALVIAEPEHNVGRARNRGAKSASGETLVFLDADVLIPDELLPRVHRVVSASPCVGGAVDTEYGARKWSVRVYIGLWRVLGKVARMAQGAAQFCRRDAFLTMGGYDESLYMGEDVDFYFRLRRYARRTGGATHIIRDLKVRPSARRFDQWPFWRTLMWTNPLVAGVLRRSRSAWTAWYDTPVR